MEPSLEQIEDYNGKEPKNKRKIVYLVVAGLLVFGIVWDTLRTYYFNDKVEIYTPKVEKKEG